MNIIISAGEALVAAGPATKDRARIVGYHVNYADYSSVCQLSNKRALSPLKRTVGGDVITHATPVIVYVITAISYHICPGEDNSRSVICDSTSSTTHDTPPVSRTAGGKQVITHANVLISVDTKSGSIRIRCNYVN